MEIATFWLFLVFVIKHFFNVFSTYRLIYINLRNDFLIRLQSCSSRRWKLFENMSKTALNKKKTFLKFVCLFCIFVFFSSSFFFPHYTFFILFYFNVSFTNSCLFRSSLNPCCNPTLLIHSSRTAKGRTNIELREQFILADGVSQSMTAFKPKTSASSPSGSSASSLRTPAGPITKVLHCLSQC